MQTCAIPVPMSPPPMTTTSARAGPVERLLRMRLPNMATTEWGQVRRLYTDLWCTLCMWNWSGGHPSHPAPAASRLIIMFTVNRRKKNTRHI